MTYPAPVRGPGEYFVVVTTSIGPSAAWRVSDAGAPIDTIEDIYVFMPMTKAVFDGTNYGVVGSYGEGAYATGVGVQLVRPDGTVVHWLPMMATMLDTTTSRYSSKAVRPATNDDGITAAVFSSYEQACFGSKRVRAGVWAPLGVNEANNVAPGVMRPGASILRGVLLLPGDRGPGTGDRTALLDVTGRRVMNLQPGANDVRALASGVYFVGEGLGARGRGTGRIRKVIVSQ
jgi:hypothetical protein